MAALCSFSLAVCPAETSESLHSSQSPEVYFFRRPPHLDVANCDIKFSSPYPSHAEDEVGLEAPLVTADLRI
jgi:hypothetical protein